MSTVSAAQDLRQALEKVLEPLVSLALSQGLTYGDVDETLRRLMVKCAVHDGAENVSAIHVRTGLNRREISRCLVASQGPMASPNSMAFTLFRRWSGDERLQDEQRLPKPLPRQRRQGHEMSFEALVESISTDVRPKAMLDLLVARGHADIDENDFVSIKKWAVSLDNATTVRRLEETLAGAARTITNQALGRTPRLPTLSINSDPLGAAAVVRLIAEITPPIERLMFGAIEQLEPEEQKEKASPSSTQHTLRFGYYIDIDPPLPKEVARDLPVAYAASRPSPKPG
jgi:hypothetical protein